MSEGVIIAVVSGLLTLVGTIITVIVGNNKNVAAIEKTQAVMENKVDTLAEEVKKHNNFAQRLPVIEEQVRNLDGRVSRLEVHNG